MQARLVTIAIFAALLSALSFACMRAAPQSGWLRIVKRVGVGYVLFYVCRLLFSAFGAELSQGPLAAVVTGLWGLPGALLALFFQQPF